MGEKNLSYIYFGTYGVGLFCAFLGKIVFLHLTLSGKGIYQFHSLFVNYICIRLCLFFVVPLDILEDHSSAAPVQGLSELPK